jgi:hypothetical protein
MAHAGLRRGRRDDNRLAEFRRSKTQRFKAGRVDAIVIGEQELHEERAAWGGRRDSQAAEMALAGFV